jgi:hypothetical protein
MKIYKREVTRPANQDYITVCVSFMMEGFDKLSREDAKDIIYKRFKITEKEFLEAFDDYKKMGLPPV